MMEIITAKNVTMYDADEGSLDMQVLFSHMGNEFVPFTAKKDDPELHGRELYRQAMLGNFGPITERVAEPMSESQLRALLADKLQKANVAMAPLEDADKLGIISSSEKSLLTIWQQYRVALYRIPQSEGWPQRVEWPRAPSQS